MSTEETTEDGRGTLRPGRPHPVAHLALLWIRSQSASELAWWQESFASTALSGNYTAEVCGETLRRLQHGEPVSDRYLLGLAWAIRDGVDFEKTIKSEGFASAVAALGDDAGAFAKDVRSADPSNALKDRVDELEETLHRIRSWCDAYPLAVFPEPDFGRAEEVLAKHGMGVSAISASNMRHVLDGVSRIIEEGGRKWRPL